MINVTWEQHAVGHGGFHVGRARSPHADEPFVWIYDCGAKRHAQFAKQLSGWTEAQTTHVDWLFVSHFDTDHVSGLETLMSKIEVRDVMLPYVNDDVLVASLTAEFARGRYDRWFVDLVADPARWFLSRGASRVTFLQSPGEDPDLPREPIRPEPDDGKGWRCKTAGTVSALPLDDVPPSADPSPIRLAKSDVALVMHRDHETLRLNPFCHPIGVAGHTALLTELMKLVPVLPTSPRRPGLGNLAHAVASHARTSRGRAALRAVYKAHAGSSNRASLSLLSLWERERHELTAFRHMHIQAGPDQSDWFQEDGVGWLNTGDAELVALSDLAAWQTHYGSDLQKVRVLSLPHHGSDRNSAKPFQDGCPSAILTAHVKDGSSKHPGPGVRGLAGHRLACVTNEQATRVRMVI